MSDIPITRCRSCGAAIIWATTTATGKPSPYNAEPDPTGGWVIMDAPGGPVAVHAGPTAVGHDRRTSHFATCRDADTWRKTRPGAHANVAMTDDNTDSEMTP